MTPYPNEQTFDPEVFQAFDRQELLCSVSPTAERLPPLHLATSPPGSTAPAARCGTSYQPEADIVSWTAKLAIHSKGIGFCAVVSVKSQPRTTGSFSAKCCCAGWDEATDAFSLKWERNAALPADRIATLKAFCDRSWVSLEPTLDLASSLSIVNATHEFVDFYKVGRANYVPTITQVLDWRDYTLRMMDKLRHYGRAHYFKKDLQPYLPPGYHSPLRVAQHH